MRELNEFEGGEAYLVLEKLKHNRIRIRGSQSNIRMPSVVDGEFLTVSFFDFLSFIMRPECNEEIIFGTTSSFKLNDEYATAAPDSLQADFIEVSLKLKSLGRSPFDVAWFYYDSEEFGDLRESKHSFFVVVGQNILIEDANFTEEAGGWFSFGLWGIYDLEDDRSRTIASNRYWYKKFYTESKKGQVLILRPDAETHFYPIKEIQAPSELELSLQSRLSKIEEILKFILVITGILLIKAFF